MSGVDRLHGAIYANDIGYVREQIEPLREALRDFPAFVGDQTGVPLTVAQLMIQYLAEQPTSELLSTTVSERTYSMISGETLLNEGPTRVPPTLIDALFIAHMTMHKTSDSSLLSYLLEVKAPIMNTLTFNPYSYSTEALQKQYRAEELDIFDDQMTLMKKHNPMVEKYKEFFSEKSSHTPLELLVEGICDKLKFAETLESYDGENQDEFRTKLYSACDMILDTLTPFRMVSEIAIKEYGGNHLPDSTTLTLYFLNEAGKELSEKLPPNSPLIWKFSTIQAKLRAHAQSFSKEEIRYARSQVCLFIQARVIKPRYTSLGELGIKSDSSEEALILFHRSDEMILDAFMINDYQDQFGPDAFPPLGRVAFDYEIPKEGAHEWADDGGGVRSRRNSVDSDHSYSIAPNQYDEEEENERLAAQWAADNESNLRFDSEASE